MKLIAAIAMTAWSSAALSAVSVNDFARGVRIDANAAHPLVELSIPDEIYRNVTSASLADLAVFNAEGSALPHAICPGPQMQSARIENQVLPIFQSTPSSREVSNGANIEVQTAAGTRVHVDEQHASVRTETRHLIDAREVQAPIRAISFDWSSSDHASEVKVSIESSTDLDAWRVVVPASTLLRANGAQNALRRDRVELPRAEYKYLRVRRVDGGPLLELHSVVAEVVQAAEPVEPVWITAQAASATNTAELFFYAARLAPISFARIRVPFENSSLRVDVASRANDKSPWISRWSGESFVVTSDNQRRESDPARFAATTDRYWRVRVAQGSIKGIALELGYYPSRIHFLAQGSAPYTLAFGSRRAHDTEIVPCGALLTNLSERERAKLTQQVTPGSFEVLGGDAALQPAPRKTPTRLIVLWGSLVVGVGILIAMALSLLKRLRNPADQP
jgi:hypothetical protein